MKTLPKVVVALSLVGVAVLLTGAVLKITLNNLTATGTPSASTYLRGDWTWSAVSGSGSGDMTKAEYDANNDGDIDDGAIPAGIARDSEVAAGYLAATVDAPAANHVWVSFGANRVAVPTPVTIDPQTGAMTIPSLNVTLLTAAQFTPADRSIDPSKIAQAGATTGQALVWNGSGYLPASWSGGGSGDTVVTTWPTTASPGTFYFNTTTQRRRYYANTNDYWESPAYTQTDGTAPTVLTARINTVNDAEVLTFDVSESIVSGVNGTSGVTVALSGGAATAAYLTGDGSNAPAYTLSRRVAANETGTATYTQPGDGWKDAAGNLLATLSAFSITNQSSYSASAGAPTVLDTTWSTSGGTTITLDATGAAEGSLLIAAIGTISTSSISLVPDGWTMLHVVDAGNSSAQPLTAVYTKVASASEGSYTWTMSLSNRFAAFVLECGDVTVVDTATSSASPTLGVITVPAGGIALAIASRAAASNTADAVVPSGYTELVDIFGTGYRAGASAAWRSITGDTNGTDTYDDPTGSDSTIHIALAP